jgi:hypothetical protein
VPTQNTSGVELTKGCHDSAREKVLDKVIFNNSDATKTFDAFPVITAPKMIPEDLKMV